MNSTNSPKNTACSKRPLSLRLLITGAIILSSLTNCSPPASAVKIIERLKSPDGKHDALWVEVDTGATGDAATWVAIVESGSSTVRQRDIALLGDGTETVRMWWWPEGTLEIHHDFTGRGIKQTHSPVRGIEIMHMGK